MIAIPLREHKERTSDFCFDNAPVPCDSLFDSFLSSLEVNNADLLVYCHGVPHSFHACCMGCEIEGRLCWARDTRRPWGNRRHRSAFPTSQYTLRTYRRNLYHPRDNQCIPGTISVVIPVKYSGIKFKLLATTLSSRGFLCRTTLTSTRARSPIPL